MQPSTTISKSQRVIKFRAWDGEKMHYDVVPWQWDFVISLTWHRCEKSTGDGILGSGGKTGEFLVPGISFKNLMQFTGLLDKNGKEIYEHDIVYSSTTTSGIKIQWVVVWHNGSWRIKDSKTNKRTPYIPTKSFWKSVEVIGNIYENPELLNP